MNTRPEDDSPVYELRGITKAYGQVQALRGVSLALRAGEIHAVLGDNGAGKSTLLKVAAGAIRPDEGEIRLRGEEIGITQPDQVRKLGIETVYTLSGATAGLAGLVDVARFAGASVTTGHVTELIAAIAAVIIGGASLTGGVGVMAGTFVGVLIPTILNNGLIILGFQRFWQDIAIGIVLVVAVAFGQWQRGRDERLAHG